jgi:transcriptional antiterminator NusG
MNTEVTNKTDMKWYTLRTQGNREKSVAERLKKEAENGDLIGKVGQVIVPLEKIVYLKDGKKVQKEKIMLPGYIFMETNSLGELKYFLKSVKGVAGFLTERNGDIKSLTENEVNRMIGRHTESMNKETTVTFIIGEEVMINEGPFTSMKATIEKIEDHKVTLVVSIFGRKTPLTLDSHQIDKMHA